MRTALLLTLALATVALAGCSFDMASDSSLITACKEWVKEDLKSPSTADFGDESVDSGPDDEGFYQVSGHVDAENSFGATVRGDWSCEIRVDDAEDGWEGRAMLEG